MDINETMDEYVTNLTPNVTYGPTLSGGTGTRALRRFYEQHFFDHLPESMHLRLISRTIGSDRIVDELFVSFEHTQEIPWLLPGVGPTNKKVEFVLVSIVSLRSGKLYSEHVYWDQASVLVQVGLLDPKLVSQGVDRLPVIGRESARRILNEDPEVDEPAFHNRLINRGKKRRGSKAASSTLESQVQSEAESTPLKGKPTGVENGRQNGEAQEEKGIHDNETEAEADAEDEADTETETNGADANGAEENDASEKEEKKKNKTDA
jgi:hypothetical protein